MEAGSRADPDVRGQGEGKGQALRIIAGVLLIGLAGLAIVIGNDVLFSFWAAGGPPVANPDYFVRCGVRDLFALGAVALAAGTMVWYLARKRHR